MKKFLIKPSIICANFAILGKEIENLIHCGIDSIHFDVMDNHYVPNLTIGPLVLKSIREYGINIPIDVHLMIKPLEEKIVLDFIEFGANCIILHSDSTDHLDKFLQIVKNKNCCSGIALSPTSSIEILEYVIDKLDIILIMLVNPGFSGQKYIPSIIKKIKKVKKIIQNLGRRNIILEVDGGINTKNIKKLYDSGASSFVIGKEIFKEKNYFKIIRKINKILSN
ncbi:ribulose phosphate epimerase [bacterium endosymbiont of Pedicinus badii]|nr:ribulose-phosphate 3-epimerase [bacterium endosymbiont of Pedicinus badii]OQM34266.1 ribulose phosphate epimerase [bacterium endosymbiont of Pedicinus badii]